MKNVLTPLAKSVLIPFGLTATASAADAGTHKKILEPETSGSRIAIIIKSNKEIKDTRKIALKISGLLINGVTQTVENGTKEQRGGFFAMLLGTIGVSLLEKYFSKQKSDKSKQWSNQSCVGFLMPLHLKCKSITKINPILKVFILETIYGTL